MPDLRATALVALAMFRETVRDRVPLSIAAFATVIIGISYLISQMTAGQDLKIIKDLGLSALSLFGLLIAVFLGINLVSKEVERKSIYAVVAKPISRTEFLLGKYAGLVMALAVNLAAMTVAFYAVLLFIEIFTPPFAKQGWPVPATDPRLLLALTLIFAELMIVTAVALFFSTFSSPLLSAFLTLGLWVSGHFNADLRSFEAVLDVPAFVYLARTIYYVLPNLAPFDIKAEIVHGIPVAMSHVGLTLAYAAAYIALLLTGAVAVFRRRDFK